MDLNDELLAKVREVVERNTSRPAYLCTDEEWTDALDEVMLHARINPLATDPGKETFEQARMLCLQINETPPYLATEEEWIGMIIMAREMLGITATAPVCQYCGSVAPHGDERLIWISVHEGKLHRWRWKRKEKKR